MDFNDTFYVPSHLTPAQVARAKAERDARPVARLDRTPLTAEQIKKLAAAINERGKRKTK